MLERLRRFVGGFWLTVVSYWTDLVVCYMYEMARLRTSDTICFVFCLLAYLMANIIIIIIINTYIVPQATLLL